jgi:hypothetical protein
MAEYKEYAKQQQQQQQQHCVETRPHQDQSAVIEKPRKTLAFQILQTCYWGSASFLGVFGILAGSLYLTHPVEVCQASSGWCRFYLLFRFVLGIVQILAHMFVLCPARLSSEFGTWMMKLIGKGNVADGKHKYYGSFIPKCNWAVGTIAIVEFSNLLFHCISLAPNHWIDRVIFCDVVSLLVLLNVLALRFYYAHINQVEVLCEIMTDPEEVPYDPSPAQSQRPYQVGYNATDLRPIGDPIA